jgi:putative membrane protein insertion efficiency factor
MNRSLIVPVIIIVYLCLGFHQCSGQYSVQDFASPLTDDIRIYQNVLSSALGSNCRMYPSCSNYGIAVFEQKTTIMGFAKTSDRLMRCGNDLGHYKRIVISGETRIKDFPDELSLNTDFHFHYDWLEEACNEFKFICNLLDLEHYDEALLEIHRSQYNSAIDSLEVNPKLSYLEAYCYLLKNDLAKATSLCRENLNNQWDKHLAEILADSHVRAKQYENAGQIYNALIDSSNQYDHHSYSRKLVLTNTADGNYETAVAILDKNFIGVNEIKKQISRVESAHYINPVNARILAIIPGLGYLYSKQPKTALTAFLFNGMTIYATYDLLKRGQYGMGVLMTAMSMSFYIGNIYGSGRSAKKYNSIKREKMLEPLERWAFSY